MELALHHTGKGPSEQTDLAATYDEGHTHAV